MAYHGYLNFICQYAAAMHEKTGKNIKILEIGVDKGVTLFSILNNLNCVNVPYEYHGVDVKVQEHLKVMLGLNDSYPVGTLYIRKNSSVKLYETNSLEFMEKHNDHKFDIILIDGDHNYPTVSKECELIPPLMRNANTLIMFDDYHGKWSEKDLFYKDKKGYEENSLLSHLTSIPGKQGVKPAVDEFLLHPELVSFVIDNFTRGEAICVTHKDNSLLQEQFKLAREDQQLVDTHTYSSQNYIYKNHDARDDV
jgi:hypothetical protein